jgi:hypothetical protein
MIVIPVVLGNCHQGLQPADPFRGTQSLRPKGSVKVLAAEVQLTTNQLVRVVCLYASALTARSSTIHVCTRHRRWMAYDLLHP